MSNSRNNTRKNTAMLRYEAQCQARSRKMFFVMGLVLGTLFSLSVILLVRTHFHDASVASQTVVAKASISPLMQYAHASNGQSPDGSLPEDSSPSF